MAADSRFEGSFDAGVASIVIVGAGPTGVRVAQELQRRAPTQALLMLGAEPHEPYDRVQLSSALAGDVSWRALAAAARLPTAASVRARLGTEIVAIDRDRRRVRDQVGVEYPYSSLVLATGSQPHVPNVPGTALAGVYTFRNLRDAERLSARRLRSRRTVVLGGGLLGLEAARAMRRFHTEIIVVEHAERLMPRQLDHDAAALLQRSVESLGIGVVTGDGVAAIMGERSVASVRLRSGKQIDCDTVVIATGIVPNTKLALAAGLPIGRGIRVDDALRTADANIYAVGECAEHRGVVYGLIAPCFEQAAVVAATIAGQPASYAGSLATTQLKVLRIPVFSAGLMSDDAARGTVSECRHMDADSYRKLVLRDGRVVGALAVGDWAELPRVLEAVRGERRIGWWRRRRFERSGSLWQQASSTVADWPATAIVCNCTGTTCGALRGAIEAGCSTPRALARQTRASTVCGSCAPLLAELLGGSARPQATPGWRPLLVMAALAGLIAVAVGVLPDIPYLAQWRHAPWHWDRPWRSLLLKQISGYTLLAVAAIGLLLSLRKRVARLDFGSYWLWRALHVALGVGAATLLFVHTGGRFGHGVNAWLMTVFVAITAAGAMAGSLIALEHRLAPAIAKRARSRMTWLHIVAFWPLPVLLTFHVLKIYYF